ncbi:MAG: N-acetylmuramoyl-L-alanine amidase [Candidatus Saccharicenans sp.]
MPRKIKIETLLVSAIILLSSIFLPLTGQKKVVSEPVVKIEVLDTGEVTLVRFTCGTFLNYSLRKNGAVLTVSFRTRNPLKFERKPFSSRMVRSIELAKSPEAYLVILKLETADFNYNQSSRRAPFELVLEIKPNTEIKPEVKAKVEKPASQETGTAGTEKTEISSQTQKAEPERTETVRIPSKKLIKTIVIDPGHGGNETGARGVYGTLEKDVTLSIARKLKEVIERELKYRVLMTREADVTLPLERRAALANNNKADLFISIHVNGSRRTAATGSETFFLSLNATDEESRRLAYFENNSEELENRVPEKDFDDLKLILWDMAQSAYLKQSSQLAEFVQLELNELLNTRNRGVKQAPFKVLTGVACPAILVEVAFITNPEEEKKLQSEDFQMTVAEAIYRGLNKFLQLYEKP